MPFDPEIHHRRSIRFKGYDYSRDGAYFVTICSLKKECLFSSVGAGLASAQNNTIGIELKEPGEIILENWNKIPERFNNVIADDIIIMPNHIHGIIIIGRGNRDTLHDIGRKINATKEEGIQLFEKINSNIYYIQKKVLTNGR